MGMSEKLCRIEPNEINFFGRWKKFDSAECWRAYAEGEGYAPVWEPGLFETHRSNVERLTWGF